MRLVLYIAMQIAVLLLVSIVGSILLNIFGIQIDTQSYAFLLVKMHSFEYQSEYQRY